MESEYLTIKETAKMLKVTRGTLNNWKLSGVLSPYNIGGKVLYKKSEIEQALSKAV